MVMVWHILTAMIVMAGIVPVTGTALAQGSCSGITDPLQKARCAMGNIQSTGALDQGTVSGRQGAVPQYGGTSGCMDASCAGSSASGYYSDTGDVSGLNAAAGNAAATDPNATRVQQMGVDAGGYNLSTSAPVTTANTTASSITPNPNVSTCTDVTICVSWTQAPPSTQTCNRPGSGQLTCQIQVTNSIREVPITGGPGGAAGFCVDHYMYVRVLNPSPDSYVMQWLGTAPNGAVGQNCGGIGWRTFASFSFTPPTLDPDEQIVLVNFSVNVSIGGQCGGTSFSISSGQVLAIVCGTSGAQSGSVQATSWRKSWVIRKDVINDQCAGVRASGWVRMSSVVLDDAPRTVTLSDGTVQTLLPPTVAPASGAWVREEQWGFSSLTTDTCAPLLQAGCFDVASTCTTSIPGGCDTYSVTVQCGGGTVCAQQTVVQQCTSCGAPGSYVPFCMDTSTPPNQNFQIAATMLAMVQAVQDDFDKDQLRIFTGTPKACSYSTLGTLIIDCCADDPDRMLGTCTDVEISLAGDKRAQQVVLVGNHCIEWWSVGFAQICARRADVYCTFRSKLARIIQEQGKPQLGQNFGTPDAPDCDGFTLNEFAALNFQTMDFTEYFSSITTNYDQAAVAESLRQKACAMNPGAPGC